MVIVKHADSENEVKLLKKCVKIVKEIESYRRNGYLIAEKVGL